MSKTQNRPKIVYTPGSLPQAVTEAEKALLAAPKVEVFQHAGRLVRIAPESTKVIREEQVQEVKSPKIIEIKSAWLVDTLTSIVDWAKPGRDGEPTAIDCPPRVASTLLVRSGKWSAPTLVGITDAPTLRPDGSVLSKQGYDDGTGIYCELGRQLFKKIPGQLSEHEARKALKRLKAVLKDFAFESPADTSVALAAILTGLVRRSLRTAPMFGFTAPDMGSGKTLLADVVATIATGRPAVTTSQAKSDVEDQKALFAFLISGDPVVCIDNVERPLRADTLANMLTTAQFKGRILGHSRIVEVSTATLFLATGNHLRIEGDLVTRSLLCSIDPKSERPEQRTFDVNLRSQVMTERRRLVVAGLTVLRAFVAAGRPYQGLVEFGRFEDWSRMVREPLVWLGEADPCETREKIMQADVARSALGAILRLWEARYGSDEKTMREVTEDLPSVPDLREAFANAQRSDRALNPHELGTWAKSVAGRVVDGRRLEAARKNRNDVTLWRVVQLGQGSTSAISNAENGAAQGEAAGVVEKSTRKRMASRAAPSPEAGKRRLPKLKPRSGRRSPTKR